MSIGTNSSCSTIKLNVQSGFSHSGIFAPMTWSKPLKREFDVGNLWTDGEHIYYSNWDEHYVLNGTDWEVKNWKGHNFSGFGVWSDGEDFYYAYNGDQLILNGDTWEEKRWDGSWWVNHGGEIWTDGTYTYLASGSSPYFLDKETNSWKHLALSWPVVFTHFLWSDGTNIYCSRDATTHHVFNKETRRWTVKTWYVENADGSLGREINPSSAWSDGSNTYCTYNGENYILNGDTWKLVKFKGISGALSGGRDGNVWTDGKYIYRNDNTVLLPSTAKLYSRVGDSWSEMGAIT